MFTQPGQPSPAWKAHLPSVFTQPGQQNQAWKGHLPPPNKCSLSLASPAQPGRDIYHFRTLHSEWPAQSRLLSQGSPAWLSQAKPAGPSQPCLQSETGPRGPEPSQIGLKVKNIKILNEKLCFLKTRLKNIKILNEKLCFLRPWCQNHSFSLSILIFLTFSPI